MADMLKYIKIIMLKIFKIIVYINVHLNWELINQKQFFVKTVEIILIKLFGNIVYLSDSFVRSRA